MVVGDKITELRKKYNYTQEFLAEKIGVTRQTVSNWESNITSPDLNQASLLCDLLKVSINDLIDKNLEIDVKDNSDCVLNKLIGNNVIIGFDDYFDTEIGYNKNVKVISVNDEFIKIETNKKIVKLIDMNLVRTIKMIEEVK